MIASHKRLVVILAVPAGVALLVAGYMKWKDVHEPNSPQATAPTVVSFDPQQFPFLDSSLDQESRLLSVAKSAHQFPLSQLRTWISDLSPRTLPTFMQSRDLVIFNEVVAVHLTRPESLEPTIDFLTKVLEDASLHSVVRDYAAQHLVYSVTPDRGQANLPILQALINALSQPDLSQTTIPGTIVNALHGFADKGVTLPEDLNRQVSLASAHLIKSPATPLSLQISLVQTAGAKSSVIDRTILRTLLEDESTPVPLAMAACASLGKIGIAEDLGFLSSVSRRPSFLSHPASQAHLKLQAKLNLSGASQ